MIFPVTRLSFLRLKNPFFPLQLDVPIDNVPISNILAKILNNMMADMCAFRIAIQIKPDSATR